MGASIGQRAYILHCCRSSTRLSTVKTSCWRSTRSMRVTRSAGSNPTLPSRKVPRCALPSSFLLRMIYSRSNVSVVYSREPGHVPFLKGTVNHTTYVFQVLWSYPYEPTANTPTGTTWNTSEVAISEPVAEEVAVVSAPVCSPRLFCGLGL